MPTFDVSGISGPFVDGLQLAEGCGEVLRSCDWVPELQSAGDGRVSQLLVHLFVDDVKFGSTPSDGRRGSLAALLLLGVEEGKTCEPEPVRLAQRTSASICAVDGTSIESGEKTRTLAVLFESCGASSMGARCRWLALIADAGGTTCTRMELGMGPPEPIGLLTIDWYGGPPGRPGPAPRFTLCAALNIAMSEFGEQS